MSLTVGTMNYVRLATDDIDGVTFAPADVSAVTTENINAANVTNTRTTATVKVATATTSMNDSSGKSTDTAVLLPFRISSN